MDFSMVGPALALGLSGVGSTVGSWIAGATCHGVMSRVDEGHGKFIALSAAPSSQIIYGFILMLLMSRAIIAGTLSPISAIGIAVGSGFIIGTSAIFQGLCCASAIQASAKKPAVYGKCWVAVGIIESFAIFALVFSMLLLQ